MTQVTFKGSPVSLVGNLPSPGDKAPACSLVANDLSVKTLADFPARALIVASVPSLDTSVCDLEARRFNQEASAFPDTFVLVISRDLPFAQKRWCGAAGVLRVVTLSDFRGFFGKAFGVEIADGPLAGLLARAVWILDSTGTIRYTQLVPEITHEPDYASVLTALRSLLQK